MPPRPPESILPVATDVPFFVLNYPAGSAHTADFGMVRSAECRLAASHPRQVRYALTSVHTGPSGGRRVTGIYLSCYPARSRTDHHVCNIRATRRLMTRSGNLFAGIRSYGLIVNRLHRDLHHILKRGQ